MSSIENRPRTGVTVTALFVGAAVVSSLSFSAQVEAQAQPTEREQTINGSSNLQVAVIGGAFAAYGWLAAKSYDLGREVGKSMAGSPPPSEEQSLSNENLEYLLD